jgi:MFS family permease
VAILHALALLLACLGMLGPFAIDTYLPAFAGIAETLGASPLQMQQTLSAYLLGFGVMNLFHGALADSYGRRPVILGGVAVFTLASVGCALAATPAQLIGFRALQGLATGAGTVVSRAVIRDMFPPADAQRVMSQVTLFFGVAPAIAPVIGGLLFVRHINSIAWVWYARGVKGFIPDARCRGCSTSCLATRKRFRIGSRVLTGSAHGSGRACRGRRVPYRCGCTLRRRCARSSPSPRIARGSGRGSCSSTRSAP